MLNNLKLHYSRTIFKFNIELFCIICFINLINNLRMSQNAGNGDTCTDTAALIQQLIPANAGIPCHTTQIYSFASVQNCTPNYRRIVLALKVSHLWNPKYASFYLKQKIRIYLKTMIFCLKLYAPTANSMMQVPGFRNETSTLFCECGIRATCWPSSLQMHTNPSVSFNDESK